MKLTKIIATIGPACESDDKISNLIETGVDVFRFNFKHNTIEWHEKMLKKVKAIASKMNRSVGTMIDLQGPEIRLNLEEDRISFKKDEEILLSEKTSDEKVKAVALTHPEIISHLKDGQKILVDDGAYTFKVKIKNNKHYFIPEGNGVLENRKSLNIPGSDFAVDVLVDRDIEGIRLAEVHKVDYVALSFVRMASDIDFLREELKKAKCLSKLISKIETRKAIENLDEIINKSDSIMVARGDLGVELPMEEVPFYQKLIIKKCIEKAKGVITATQMLQSMIDSPMPTRAEVSDVANATYDLTDAVMLSAETASGKYPLEAVKAMSDTVSFNEKKFQQDIRHLYDFSLTTITELICDAAYNLYEKALKMGKIAAFVVFTKTGGTAVILSRYRPNIPIFAITPTDDVANRLNLNYGVFPILSGLEEVFESEVNKEAVEKAIETLIEDKYVKKNELVIVMHGDYWGVEGAASNVKVMRV